MLEGKRLTEVQLKLLANALLDTPWIYGSAVAIGVPSLFAIRRWSRLRAPTATAVRLRRGRVATPRAGARGSSRPWYALLTLAFAAERLGR